jgi:hypothetical protein
MKEIRKILIKARSDRREKDKAYVVINLDLSSEDSAVNFNEEIIKIKLNYEFFLFQ